MNDTLQGTIIFFTKSYGFIASDAGGPDVFVHYSDIEMEGYKVLKKGQRVSYQLGQNIKGQPKAVAVSILK